MLLIYLFFVITYNVSFTENSFLGCYKVIPNVKKVAIQQYRIKEDCVNDCFVRYYRYSYIPSEGNCMCGNYLGEEVSNVSCTICDICDFTQNLTDTYATGSLVPGPPKNFHITNVTERSVHISWEEPESFVQIDKYQVQAIVIHTFSGYPPISPEWMYSNNTFHTDIITLFPATKYNITLSTTSPDGDGATVHNVIQTKIDVPDNNPAPPILLENDGSKITIQLLPTLNNNGPVSGYKIIVINNDAHQGFDQESLVSYREAMNNGATYYIAAELLPTDITKKFVVGDGKFYGQYYNAPLKSNVNYNIVLAVVSRMNGTEKVAYSDPSITSNGVLILNVNNDQIVGDSPAVIIGLSIAIGLLTFMLIAGIIGFIILKSRVVNRRQRLSDNQELTLQGPMIEVENNGYIHEEEHEPVNHYKNLRQKVRTISANQIKVEPTSLLGVGKFGRVNSGTLNEGDTLIPIAAYNIQDKKLSQEAKKSMLRDLDILIKVGKHDNLIGLVGTCETSQMVCVVLEYTSMNLKDLLLGSRDALPGRFSNMSESQAFDIILQIAKGMVHLESVKIIHKQLCARSIMISNGFTPKISNYGIAQYYNHNKIPDYTRWTATEVFKNHPHNPRSDVWSFSCVMWEISALGGTPYGNVSNNEIPEKIVKGLRLPQLRYIGDELYQIMLDCWQLDCDERPKFSQLIETLKTLQENTLTPCFNFNLYPNFQYEQFYPDMEIAVRPVF